MDPGNLGTDLRAGARFKYGLLWVVALASLMATFMQVIIGATVMPHNLYLHSPLVQSRKLQKDEPSIRSAIRFNGIDSIVALTIAFFVNAAILVLEATVFL